jgi:hypothetical protein
MIQNNNYTYNGVLNILESFTSSHIDVRRFVAEDEDQMSEITSKDELFPMMFVAPINNIYDWQINQYELRVYVYDRIMKDRSNINDIRSKTNQILNDLDVWLRKYDQLPVEITNVSVAYPFSSELMTDVSGWYFDVVLDIPSYEVCKIPFENPVVITGYTCDIQYTNQYLTCGELGDCPIIQTIQSDIISISGKTDLNYYTTGATLNGTVLEFDRNDLVNAYNVNLSGLTPDLSGYLPLSGGTLTGELITTIERWTFDFMDKLDITIYADDNLSIDEVTNIVASPTISIEVNDVVYTLTNPIVLGDKIKIISNIPSVVKLKIVK